jgi:hypothetical protein
MNLNTVAKADGEQRNIAGIFIVDEEKLQNLPDEQIVDLHKSGALRGIHTHLFSLANVNLLMERQAARKGQTQKS